MSDVMPYSSSKFSELNEQQIEKYQSAFHQQVTEAVLSFGPDIIHSHHLWLLSSLVKANFPQIPMVTSCHGTDLRQFLLCPHLQTRVLSGCQKIEKILALTLDQKQSIASTLELPHERIAVTGAGFDQATFSYKRRRRSSSMRLLYCGKLSTPKGVPYLLEALLKLDDKKIHLDLVGSGTNPDQERCLALAEKLGERVTVHGSVDQHRLAELMQTADFFILPSLFEGLPLVILEALACGCRILTTDLPGCLSIAREIEEDLLSIIDLPPMDTIDTLSSAAEQMFVEAIIRSLHQALQQFAALPAVSEQQIMRNVRPFIWSTIYQNIDAIYHQLIQA